jgi:hypothetical protein
MPDYEQGKIYIIWSPNTDKVYIGSTCQPLHKRFNDHKRSSNNPKFFTKTTVKEVFDYRDARIELIEDYPCANRAELNRREGHIIREHNCVNHRIEGRTRAEHYQDNKEQHALHMQAYRQQNKEAISAQRKEYYQRPEVKARNNELAREKYHRKKEERQP